MNRITNLELQKMRFYNNGLVNKFIDYDECIKSLIGIQCQYQTYALISIYNRTDDNRNIFENDNFIKSWGQRTTLHIFHKEDYNLISSLYYKKDNWVYKYFKFLNLDYSEYLDSILNYFNNSEDAILEKKDIQNIIPQFKSKEVMEWSGLLILATYHKIIYGLLNQNDKKIYVKNRIEENINVTVEDLLYRYFKYYGPATTKDFLHWSGLKYKDIKNELDKFIGKTKYFEIDGKKYYYETLPNEEQLKIKYPVILGKFDPLLISYNEKDWILNGKNKNLIWKQAGQIEGVILFSKGLKATWHYKLKNDEVIFEVSEIENLNQSERKQIERKFNKIGKRVFNKDTLINYFGGN